MNTTLASRLRQAREDLGMTQLKLAEHLDISRTLVTHWEAGRRTPKLMQLRAIAKCLGTDPVYLFLGNTQPIAKRTARSVTP